MPWGSWSSRSLSRCFRTLTFLWLCCIARSAQAEPRVFVELDYRTDATLDPCPSEASFRLMVEDQLGYDPFRAGSAYRVVARAQPGAAGIKGLVQWRDASGAPRGERELSSERVDCREFARVMSFAIVVQIQLLAQSVEQSAAGDAAPAEDASSTTRPVATSPAPSENRVSDAGSPVISDSASAEEGQRQFMLGAGPVVGFGFAAAATFGGRVFARLRRGQLGVELGAEASLPSRHTLSEGEGFEQHFIAGSLAGCAFVRALAGCVVNKWGTLQIRGFGVDLPRESSGLVGLAGLRLMLSEQLAPRWVGALRVEGLATLAPWRVSLNQRQIWVTPTFSLCLGADLGTVF